MSEHAGFHAAILAAPEDDLPRLIYADWLDERGDPRGEFIRLQIAAHHGDSAAARDAAILERLHGAEWAGRLASWAYQADFSRGFVESLVIRGDEFLGHVAAIFRLAPIRRVTLIGVRESLRQILRMPHLAYLSALHLTGCGLSDREGEKIAYCPHLTSLRSLRLGHNDIGCAGLAAIADSESLTQLRQLDLSNNDVGDWGARALAGTHTLTHLQRLDLTGNAITPAGEGALQRSPALAATEINLDRQRTPGVWAKPARAKVS